MDFENYRKFIGESVVVSEEMQQKLIANGLAEGVEVEFCQNTDKDIYFVIIGEDDMLSDEMLHNIAAAKGGAEPACFGSAGSASTAFSVGTVYTCLGSLSSASTAGSSGTAGTAYNGELSDKISDDIANELAHQIYNDQLNKN